MSLGEAPREPNLTTSVMLSAKDPSPPAARVPRVGSIDVARGAAMLLVFLAHFQQEVMGQAPGAAEQMLFRILDLIIQVAAPAFVLISGLTLAMVLARVAPSRLTARKLEVIDRATFMLLAGHLILSITEALLAGTPRPWNQVFITDVIAVSLVLGVLILPRWPVGRVVALACASFALGWWMHLTVKPSSQAFRVVADFMYGLEGGPIAFGYPLMQWFALFLTGAALGQTFARLESPKALARWGRKVVTGALGLVVVAVTIRMAFRVPMIAGSLNPGITSLIQLGSRTPPGLVHLMVFGGLGAALVGLANLLPEGSPVARSISVLGRASLFAFFLQSLVYRDIVARMPLAAPWTWPLVFSGSVVGIWFATRWWDSIGGNRWFRLGLAARHRTAAPAR